MQEAKSSRRVMVKSSSRRRAARSAWDCSCSHRRQQNPASQSVLHNTPSLDAGSAEHVVSAPRSNGSFAILSMATFRRYAALRCGRRRASHRCRKPASAPDFAGARPIPSRTHHGLDLCVRYARFPRQGAQRHSRFRSLSGLSNAPAALRGSDLMRKALYNLADGICNMTDAFQLANVPSINSC